MVWAEITFLLLCVGIIAGALVGLVGVGSTLVILPTLLLWFPHFLPASLAVKMTVATTLACASISVIFASILHFKSGNVRYKVCYAVIGLYLITATVGPYIVHALPAKVIVIILSVVLLVLAVRLIMKKAPKLKDLTPISPLFFAIAILIAGFANSLCGIGAGNVAIPYLSRHFAHKQAVAISVVSTVFACSIGTISYIVYGWGLAVLPKYALGYVYLPAFLAISAGILIGTPIGYKLSGKVHPQWIRYLLALLIGFAGIFAVTRVI